MKKKLSAYEKLWEVKPKAIVPMIRDVDKETFELVKKKVEMKGIRWKEAWMEMASLWLKEK